MRQVIRTAATGLTAAGVFLLIPAAHGATAGGVESTPTPADTPEPREVRTSVDRDHSLDPEGDEVVVAGTGYAPDTTLRVALWGIPADEATADTPGDGANTGDPSGEDLPGVADVERHVDVEVSDQGVFSAELDVAADFAAEIDPETDAFEVRVHTLDVPDGATDIDAETSQTGGDSGGAEHAALTMAPARLPVTFAAPRTTAAAPAPATPASPSETEDAPTPPPTSRETPATAPASPNSTEGSGGQELSVSPTTGLDPDGDTVTVTGSGYDTSKGIYVALCDVSGANSSQAPGPCLGGVDMDGGSGNSVWISSNPPPYGESLAEPYEGSGTDGGFTVRLSVVAADEFTDCMDSGTECAVVTRNDHTRGSDRGQDVFVPVSFAGQDGSGGGSGGSGGSGGGDESGGNSSNSGGSAGSGGSGGSGSLPRTGAAVAGLLAVAAAACAAGAATMRLARRRTAAR